MTSASFTTLTKPLFYIPLAVLALLLLGAAVFLGAQPRVSTFSDYPTLYTSAKAALEGHGLYRPYLYGPYFADTVFASASQIITGEELSKNLNPPAAIMLTAPLALLPLQTSYYLNCLVQLGLGLFVLLRLLPHFGFTAPAARWLAIAAFCFYYPVFANFYIGQLGGYLLALLGLAWLALQRGSLRTAGLWLGLALTFKLFTGLLFIWLLLQRRWLVLWYGALLWCLLQLAALLLFGPHELATWLQIALHYDHAGLSWNAALNGSLQRYLSQAPLAGSIIYTLAALLAGAALLWLQAQNAKLPAAQIADLGFAASIALMLFLSPLGWIYYFPALLLAAGLIYKWSAGHSAFLLCALALSAIPLLLTTGHFLASEQPPLQAGLLQSAGSLEHLAAYVVPETATLALLLFVIAALRAAYTSKSAQMGA